MLLRPGMLPCKLQFLRLLPRRRRLGNERVKLLHNGETFEASPTPEVECDFAKKNLIIHHH